MIWFMDLGQIYFAVTKGYFYQWLRSRFWFVFNLKSFLKARRKVQKNRQIGDKELTKNFTSQILYQEVSNPLLDKIANPIMNAYWQFIKKII